MQLLIGFTLGFLTACAVLRQDEDVQGEDAAHAKVRYLTKQRDEIAELERWIDGV